MPIERPRPAVTGNLASPRARRARARPAMEAFDRLPPGLRRWLAGAALPWSAESALRIWRRALAETGSEAAALARCQASERLCLGREAGRVWGRGHPGPD